MNALMYQAYGIHLCDYLLIIEPAEPVRSQLKAFKAYFLKTHRYPNAIVTKGHLTLARFFLSASYEKQIIRKLERLAITVIPFEVELQGFGSFGHSLYLDVKSSAPIHNLLSSQRRQLRPILNSSTLAPPYFSSKPHLTIARGLTPAQHDVIWPIWNRTKYTGKFAATHMTLLKRPLGGVSYTVVRRFHFQAIPPAYVQGSLFA